MTNRLHRLALLAGLLYIPVLISGCATTSSSAYQNEVLARTSIASQQQNDCEPADVGLLPAWLLGRGNRVDRHRFEASVGIAPDVPAAWPIDHPERQVISEYGNIRGRKGGRIHIHSGIDIKAPRGTPILATADGTVKLSGSMSGYGNIVIVDHGNGLQTVYAHLDSRNVNVGDVVRRGDTVGSLGATGRVTTHHLHYEVRAETRPIDPVPYLPEPNLETAHLEDLVKSTQPQQ